MPTCRCLAIALLLALGFSSNAFSTPVWIVSNGFHSSLAVRVRDVPELRALPVAHDANFLLIGWGDSQWYRGNVNASTACSAVLWPTPSVLLLVPLREKVASKYSHSDVIRLELSRQSFEKLRARIDGEFARNAAGKPIRIEDGFVPGSEFYAARESFYFPKMCNYWVAEQLQKSGLHLSRFRSISAAGLVHETAPLGTLESRLHAEKDYF